MARQRRTRQEWAGVIQFPLPGRAARPRRQGITMVLDKGLGLGQTRDLLEIAGPYMDFLKAGPVRDAGLVETTGLPAGVAPPRPAYGWEQAAGEGSGCGWADAVS